MELRFLYVLFALRIIHASASPIPSADKSESAEQTLLEAANSTFTSTKAIREQSEALTDEVKAKVEHMQEHNETNTEKRSAEQPDEPVKDEVNAESDDKPTVPMDSKPFRPPTSRRKRQFGWSSSAYNFPFASGSFYNYNPYTLSAVSGFYNNFGAAYTAVGPGGFPVSSVVFMG